MIVWTTDATKECKHKQISPQNHRGTFHQTRDLA